MDLHVEWQQIANAFPSGYVHQMKFNSVVITTSQPASLGSAGASPVNLSPAQYFTTNLRKKDESVHDTVMMSCATGAVVVPGERD